MRKPPCPLCLAGRSWELRPSPAGAVAATSLVGCGSTGDKKADKQEEAAADPYEGAQIFYSTCPPECQHHNLKAYVIDGKIAKVESSELNDCAACARGIARGFMTKDPDRLTKPLLRTGDKGSGEFKESNGPKPSI